MFSFSGQHRADVCTWSMDITAALAYGVMTNWQPLSNLQRSKLATVQPSEGLPKLCCQVGAESKDTVGGEWLQPLVPGKTEGEGVNLKTWIPAGNYEAKLGRYTSRWRWTSSGMEGLLELTSIQSWICSKIAYCIEKSLDLFERICKLFVSSHLKTTEGQENLTVNNENDIVWIAFYIDCRHRALMTSLKHTHQCFRQSCLHSLQMNNQWWTVKLANIYYNIWLSNYLLHQDTSDLEVSTGLLLQRWRFGKWLQELHNK